MEKQFNINLQNRKVLRSILTRTPLGVLAQIPEGYRNNIWWNMAHTVAIQQILLYRFSGLECRADEQFVDTYKKGTFPSENVTPAEIDTLSSLLIDTSEQAKEDYFSGIFKKYEEYTTSTKVTISSVEDAINFNNFHEGLHLGVILSQLKALGHSVF